MSRARAADAVTAAPPSGPSTTPDRPAAAGPAPASSPAPAAAPAPVSGPGRASWSGRQWSVLLVTCVGLFVTQLDLTVVNVAVGAVRRDLHTGTVAVTWVIDAYFVTFAAFMIGLGDLGDLLGRRRVFLAGLAGFALASAACASAGDVGVLIAARAAQGVAGAAVLVSSLAILTHAFPGESRTRAVGIWSAVAGSALVVGPVGGGLLVDGPGWRSVFWINVPVCLVSLIAASVLLTDSRDEAGRPIDGAGQLLAVLTLGTLSVGLSHVAGSHGSSAPGWAAVSVGTVLAALFVGQERRARAPLVPPGLLRGRVCLGANGAALLINFGTLGLLFLLSLYFEQVLEISPARAGLRIAPLFAAYAVVSLFAGRVVGRLGPRLPAGGGAGLAGLAVLVVPHVLAGSGSRAGGTVALVVCGIGIGLALPAVVSTAVTAVPADRAGLASGLNNTSRQIGGTLGVAVLGGIVAGDVRAESGIRFALAVNAAVYLLGALVCALTIPGRRAGAHSPEVEDAGVRPLPGRARAGGGAGREPAGPP